MLDFKRTKLSSIGACASAYQREEYEEATNLGRESIRTITRISSLDVDYKDDIFGNIYSIIGNSYFELDDIKASIFWHGKDLKFSRKR